MATIGLDDIVLPADLTSGPGQGQWTYQDYMSLSHDGKRYEIMDGVLLMSPSPSPFHQKVTGSLFFYLYQNVTMQGLGEVFQAPLDVKLTQKTVVQPDVFVILNENLDKITEGCIVGAPDLVIEVASPGTAAYDRVSKTVVYAQAGVREYWIVDPTKRTVEVLLLHADGYQSSGVLSEGQNLASSVVPEISSVRVQQLFGKQ